LKETKYHLRHTSEWVIRLGDGTEESHKRVHKALNNLWRYSDEIFYSDDVDKELTESGVLPELSDLRSIWEQTVKSIFAEATISIPTNIWKFEGGRKGHHSEHMGFILSDLQYIQRAYPNLEW
jgi:ring-1,2-phenylacetyl-CoA epoxidase subunit PaaC